MNFGIMFKVLWKLLNSAKNYPLCYTVLLFPIMWVHYSMHFIDTQHTNTLKAKQPVVPTVLGATTTASASAANLVRTTDLAIQLEHMKNHFKQLQQHLMIGNQHLKELQKHPNQEQNIAQLQNKLKLGVQHYQQLQQAIQQTTKQLQQQKQLAPQPSAVQVI